MTPLFTPQTGYGLYLCADNGIRPASLAETSPFNVLGSSFGRVVAVVLPSQLKFDEKRWHSMEVVAVVVQLEVEVNPLSLVEVVVVEVEVEMEVVVVVVNRKVVILDYF